MYHILPELKLRRILPAVYFVSTNPSEERVKVLLSEKKKIKFQMMAQTFLRNQILIAIWKDQVQHSTKKNPVFFRGFLLFRIFSILNTGKQIK